MKDIYRKTESHYSQFAQVFSPEKEMFKGKQIKYNFSKQPFGFLIHSYNKCRTTRRYEANCLGSSFRKRINPSTIYFLDVKAKYSYSLNGLLGTF